MHRPRRRSGRDPLWTRAPFLLRRHPGILTGLVVGGLLLSLSAAAYPLFLSGSASRFLAEEIRSPLTGRYGAGITYVTRNFAVATEAPGGQGRLLEARDAAFDRLVDPSAYLGSEDETLLGPTVPVRSSVHPRRVREVRLFAGERALAQVRILEGTDGDGVWIPDLVARGLRVGVGDTLLLGPGARGRASVVVDGVYRTLVGEPPRSYWAPWHGDIYPLSAYACALDCPIPPQFMILDRDQMLDLSSARGVGRGRISAAWQAPVRDVETLTIDDAARMRSFFGRARARASDPSRRSGVILGCCPPGQFYLAKPSIEFTSGIGRVHDLARTRIDSLSGPGRVLQVAGVLVAIAVLAGTGVFSVGARRTEFRLLAARGTGPLFMAVKAGLEAAVPAVGGAIVGLGLAYLLADAVSSGAPVASSARTDAVMAGLVAAAVAVIALAVVTPAASATHEATRSRWWLPRLIPWEAVLLGFALLAGSRLPASLASSSGAEGAPAAGPTILLFPLAFVGGLALAGARGFRVVCRWLRARNDGRRKEWYLAVHRLAGAPSLSLFLVAGAGLCLGTFVQAQAVVGSLETTVDAKARVFVGSDVQAWVPPDASPPDGVPHPVTRVGRARQAGTGHPGNVTFDLLTVDPDTFASAAFWHEGFSDRPLEGLMAELGHRPQGRVPIVVAGGDGFHPSRLDMNQKVLPVRVVGSAEAFPGMLSRRPLVIAPDDAIADAYPGTTNPVRTETATTELWVKGPANRALGALRESRVPMFQALTAAEVMDLPRLATVVDMFGVLVVLGLASAVLALAALFMYLEARQRGQVVALGLSLRMGMSSSGHRMSLVLEIVVMLMVALALGIGLGIAATAILLGRLDPLPVVPPDPLLVVPWWQMVLTLVGVAGASYLGAWVASRRAAAVPLGEALRVAE